MFSSDRHELRNIFFDAWQHYQAQLPLNIHQAEIIDIILLHPEYQVFLQDQEKYQSYDFKEDNPFLHLSLHLALREQVRLDRPLGIQEIHHNLLRKHQDILNTEHQMMLCLADILWEAQEKNTMPDEQQYLLALKKL